jgi:AmiR/NasT family two-component response regulator
MSKYPKDVKQSCFDIIAASIIFAMEEDNEEYSDLEITAMTGEIFNVLKQHLDEEGLNHINVAISHYNKQLDLEQETRKIIKSLNWNKKI